MNRALLALPYGLGLVAALATAFRAPLPALAVAVICGALGATLFSQGRLRYVALVGSLFLWIAIAGLFSSLAARIFPDWFAYSLVACFVVGMTMQTARTAIRWRLASYARQTRRTREWEWVYTGRDFALSHPLARITFGIWLILTVIILGFLAHLASGRAASVPGFVLLALHLIVLLTAIITLLRRHPLAYPLVFLLLVPGFPFTAPFMLYWADGTRPNLIYRHRFERLVPEEP